MPGGVTFLTSTNAAIPTPAAGKVTVYFSTDLGLPAYKDDAGVVHSLVGGTGSAGPIGPPGGWANEGEPGESFPIPGVPGAAGAAGSNGATGAQGPPGPGVMHEDILYPDDLLIAPAAATSSGSSGSPWVLVSSNSPSGVSSVDFINLAAYTDIRVIVRGITFGSNSKAQLRVSTDNGSTFKSASGDYMAVSGAGVETSATESDFYDTTATAARSSEMLLLGINMTTAPKSTRVTFFNTDGEGLRLIPTTSAVNAIRVFAGVNFTGGTIYVMGRV